MGTTMPAAACGSGMRWATSRRPITPPPAKRIAVTDTLGRTTRFHCALAGRLITTINPDTTRVNPDDNSRRRTE
jgi:hypothetical protein